MADGIVLASAGGRAIAYVGYTAMGDCGENCEDHAKVVRGTVIEGAVALAIGIPLLIYGVL